MLNVGFYQFHPLFGKVSHNTEKVIKALKDVQKAIIVLPELPFTGYYFQNRQELKTLAEDPQSSSTIASLVNLCKAQDLHIVTGFAEKHLDRYFNSALLLGPEGILHTYRKLHLFNQEKNWFDPGDTPLQVNEVDGTRLGIMICFDWIFPEVARTLAVQRADIICHPSNLVLNYCQQTMLSRSLENAVFAITANRFGTDLRPQGDLRFTGKSQIVAPKGDLLHRAPAQRNDLHITEIDINLARDKNITALNQMMEDRRPEFYQTLTQPPV